MWKWMKKIFKGRRTKELIEKHEERAKEIEEALKTTDTLLLNAEFTTEKIKQRIGNNGKDLFLCLTEDRRTCTDRRVG